MPRKSKPVQYATPPQLNYILTEMKVGVLTDAFKLNDGPQRDRPKDKVSYIRSLRTRAKAYGTYNPAILRPRVVSDRGNGEYWSLDGNGSNHWLEQQFGPDFKVPVYLVQNLSLPEENRMFQDIQKGKRVTKNEQFGNDREFDASSRAFRIEQVLKGLDFHTTNQVKDAFGLGATTTEWVHRRYGDSGLRLTLSVLSGAYADTKWKRTNGAFVKAVAMLLHNPDYDRDTLIQVLKASTIEEFADNARGSGGESIVSPRIVAAYEAYIA